MASGWIKHTGIVTAFVFEVAVLLALALYGVHMVNREKKGLTTAGGSFIQTLAKYEFLMEQLISRDFKIKYKRSVLGVFWSFLNPAFDDDRTVCCIQ